MFRYAVLKHEITRAFAFAALRLQLHYLALALSAWRCYSGHLGREASRFLIS
jgi:hypothetical protein